MCKLSVIISVYNSEKYVERCVESVIKQTLADIEIICINDGSTDNSLNLLENFAKKDHRIRIFSQNNKGTGEARNLGLMHANGEYVHFMDSDDFMDPEFLAEMYKTAEENKSEIVISIHRAIDEETGKILYSTSIPPSLLLNKNLNVNIDDNLILLPDHLWDKIYKKDFIKDIFFTPDGGEDIYFNYVALLKASKISIQDKCLYNYLLRKSSIQTNYKYVLSIFNNLERTVALFKNTENSKFYQVFNLKLCMLITHIVNKNLKSLLSDKAFRNQFHQKLIRIFEFVEDFSDYANLKMQYCQINEHLISEFKKHKKKQDFKYILNNKIHPIRKIINNIFSKEVINNTVYKIKLFGLKFTFHKNKYKNRCLKICKRSNCETKFYKSIIPLGFNCNLAYNIVRSFGDMDSGLFDWAHIQNTESLLRVFQNIDKFKEEKYLYLADIDMYKPQNYDILFHGKHNSAELFSPDLTTYRLNILNSVKDVKDRNCFLIEKLKENLKSNEKKLIIHSLYINKKYTNIDNEIKNINNLYKILENLGCSFDFLIICAKAYQKILKKELNRQIYVRYTDTIPEIGINATNPSYNDSYHYDKIFKEFSLYRQKKERKKVYKFERNNI